MRGRLIGEEGRGVRRSSAWSTTRGSTACSARPRPCAGARSQAITHARHRSAFGKLLADQPAMPNVLADLAVESEAATAAAMRIARAYDEDDAAVPPLRHRGREVLGLQARPPHAIEALECLGGNGYVEESGMPRLLPRLAAQLDLGGLGQRRGARRAARDGEGARGPARLHRRVRAGPRPRALDAHLDRLAPPPTPRGERAARGGPRCAAGSLLVHAPRGRARAGSARAAALRDAADGRPPRSWRTSAWRS